MANKFETPGPMTDIHGILQETSIVLMVDEAPKSKDPMPKHFREMERHGLKITNYTIT